MKQQLDKSINNPSSFKTINGSELIVDGIRFPLNEKLMVLNVNGEIIRGQLTKINFDYIMESMSSYPINSFEIEDEVINPREIIFIAVGN